MDDRGLDPRIKAAFGDVVKIPEPKASSREELIAQANTDEAVEIRKQAKAYLEQQDREDVAPSDGISITTEMFASEPDGNTINIQFIRPESAEALPCVYYIHGAGGDLSCYDGNYRTWGRVLANHGVAVAMVDFRNQLVASSVPEVGPFPAALNDCVSGVKWISANSDALAIDPDKIIVAGESGGGNLALATGLKLKQDGNLDLIRGLYAMCPSVGGGDHDMYGNYTLAYGIEEWNNRNPLAWPGFASEEDVRGLPPTTISVNEFDPTRDEGIWFYRLLLAAGVPASCRQVMGTAHAIEVFPAVCPDISRETARSIADFCYSRTFDAKSSSGCRFC